MQLNTQGYYLLVVSENGMGKRTSISEFTCQNRGGKGVKCYKITEKTGNVIGAKAVNEENEIMMITTEGIIIRLQCSDISILGRITSGVKLINLSDGVTVASFAKVREKEEDKNSEKTEEILKNSIGDDTTVQVSMLNQIMESAARKEKFQQYDTVIDYMDGEILRLFQEEGDFDMNLLHLKKKIDRMLKENLK